MMETKLLDKYLQEEKTFKPRKVLTKILVCLIILFSSLIAVELIPGAGETIQKYVYESNFSFSSFKDFYEGIAGSPVSEEEKGAQPVMAGSLEYTSVKPYRDGYELSGLGTNILSALSSGIVVYSGEKEGYNKTVIIQGSNGYDIWYGNLENIDISIYDYVKEGDILGSVSDAVYLVIMKDNKYYSYEEYLNEI